MAMARNDVLLKSILPLFALIATSCATDNTDANLELCQSQTQNGELSASALYVAPNGNDNWSGTLSEPSADLTDGPLATLRRARDSRGPRNQVRRGH